MLCGNFRTFLTPFFWYKHNSTTGRMNERTGTIQYVLRHLASTSDDTPLLRLGGYGVELQLKSLEYKTVDDSKPVEGENYNKEGERERGEGRKREGRQV